MPDYIDITIDESPIYIEIASSSAVYVDISMNEPTIPSNYVTEEQLDQAIPNGGTTGQVLTKASNTDKDTEWKTPFQNIDGGSANSNYLLTQNIDGGSA